ncbi:acyl-CoA dehydrogenase family protein [Rhodococcus sp. NPDC003348]
MTTTLHTPSADELDALRELADDMFAAIVEPHLHSPTVMLPFEPNAWDLLGTSGLTLLTTPESSGGSGAGFVEASVLLDRAGFHALPAPLGETDLLASWLLTRIGRNSSGGPAVALPVDLPLSQLADSEAVASAPWAAVASELVLVGPDFIAAVPHEQATVTPVGDLAGEHSATVRVSGRDLDPMPASSDLRDELRVRGAWIRSIQTCGALERALDLAISHVTERHQFGRPLAKFQAVQDLIARSVGLLTTAKAATAHAVTVAADEGFATENAFVATAAAKISAGQAAVGVSRNVHQALGAIGFTLDHQLRHFTTRALAWNRDFGTPTEWSAQLGRHALGSGLSVWEYAVAH